MKNTVIFTILNLMFLFNCFGQTKCKVYGISDSPQKIDCKFGTKKLNLSCDKSKYYLNGIPVIVAFHLEVQEGPSPLVFKTEHMTLTVTFQGQIDRKSELETKDGIIFGTCSKI